MDGKYFIVYFNDDPYCEDSRQYLNDYCDETKVTFDIVNGKYRFKADFGYFKTNENWKEWLEMGDKSYNDFLQEEKVNPADGKDSLINLKRNQNGYNQTKRQ